MNGTDSRERAARENNPWVALVSGLAILGAGVIFWFDRQGTIDASDYLRWWPVALIAYGLAHLAGGRWVGAVILSALGLMFLPAAPLLPNFDVSEVLGLWPLLISAGGVTLARQALQPAPSRRNGGFHAIAVMGGNGTTIAAENLEGGDAVAVMGACEINLAGSMLKGEAIIDVLAFWGGIEIIVPRGWAIEDRVTPLLGGVSITAHPADAKSPRLVLRGAAIMGGIEVRNPKEETA